MVLLKHQQKYESSNEDTAHERLKGRRHNQYCWNRSLMLTSKQRGQNSVSCKKGICASDWFVKSIQHIEQVTLHNLLWNKIHRYILYCPIHNNQLCRQAFCFKRCFKYLQLQFSQYMYDQLMSYALFALMRQFKATMLMEWRINIEKLRSNDALLFKITMKSTGYKFSTRLFVFAPLTEFQIALHHGSRLPTGRSWLKLGLYLDKEEFLCGLAWTSDWFLMLTPYYGT